MPVSTSGCTYVFVLSGEILHTRIGGWVVHQLGLVDNNPMEVGVGA